MTSGPSEPLNIGKVKFFADDNVTLIIDKMERFNKAVINNGMLCPNCFDINNKFIKLIKKA